MAPCLCEALVNVPYILGWTPASFSSSRSNKAKGIESRRDRVLQLLDEEDRSELKLDKVVVLGENRLSHLFDGEVSREMKLLRDLLRESTSLQQEHRLDGPASDTKFTKRFLGDDDDDDGVVHEGHDSLDNYDFNQKKKESLMPSIDNLSLDDFIYDGTLELHDALDASAWIKVPADFTLPANSEFLSSIGGHARKGQFSDQTDHNNGILEKSELRKPSAIISKRFAPSKKDMPEASSVAQEPKAPPRQTFSSKRLEPPCPIVPTSLRPWKPAALLLKRLEITFEPYSDESQGLSLLAAVDSVDNNKTLRTGYQMMSESRKSERLEAERNLDALFHLKKAQAPIITSEAKGSSSSDVAEASVSLPDQEFMKSIFQPVQAAETKEKKMTASDLILDGPVPTLEKPVFLKGLGQTVKTVQNNGKMAKAKLSFLE